MSSGTKLFQSFLVCCLFVGGILTAAQCCAQTSTPPPLASGDAALDAAKRAFEALAEADRIAIQDGLIWTGDYKGLADGKFGKGTRDAIMAFATRSKLPADGTLDAKGRAALAAMAKQAKGAVNFSVKADDRMGLRIGLPMRLLTKMKPLPAGTRYSSADESFSVETVTKAVASGTSPDVFTPVGKNPPATAAALQDSFNAATADAPGRKVTYKVLRPDFFVVTGEAGANTFYTRMARGERGFKGFTITYPTALKARFDPIAIAIANSFEPFPDAAAAPPPAADPSAPVALNSEPALSNLVLTASGIAITSDLIVTSLPKTCGDPRVGTKKAKILKQAETDGLTLLSLPAATSTILPIRASDPTGLVQVITLSFTPRTASDNTLMGASGDLQKGETAEVWRLLAPVQNPVAGAAVLDRGGILAALVPIDASPVKPIGGILPQMNRNVIPASRLVAFLAEARPKPSADLDPHTAGEIVALAAAAMVPIYCTR